MDKAKRELTEKEWKRRDCFETLCSEMQQRGYKLKAEKVAISVRNGYAYIGFRRRGCGGRGDD